MSFYGSTYFQLIDTFYKILVKNSKNSTETLINTPSTATELPAQASGRKGVLQFSIGNRWLVAAQDSNNSNNYTIYHGTPGGSTITKRESKKVEESTTTVNKTSDGEHDVTPLKSGDIIKVPSISYDKAGHISSSSDTYFQIPITEVETAIKDLQEKVGEPQDSKTEDLFTRAKNADTAIAAVKTTADRIRDELGAYSSVFPSTGASDYVNNTNKYKDFFATFGSMDKFRTILYEDEKSSKSLIDGILEFRETALTDIANNKNNIGTQSRLTNELTDNLTDAKNDIKALQAKDDEIDAKIDADIKQVSTNLTNTATAIRKEFKEADDAIKASITSHTETYNTRITNLEALVDSNQTSIDGQIRNLTATVTLNKTTDDARMKTIEDNANKLEKSINDNVAELEKSIGDNSNSLTALINKNSESIESLSGIVETNKAAAEDAVAGLSTRVTNLENNSASKNELNAVSAQVDQNTTSIGALATRINDVDSNISSSISSINATIASLNDTVANKAEASALNLKADKSTVDTLQATVNTKTTELGNSIEDLSSEIEDLSGEIAKKASQESLDDLAATVSGAARADAFEKYIAITDAKIAEMSKKIEELIARIEVLENPTSSNGSGEGSE